MGALLHFWPLSWQCLRLYLHKQSNHDNTWYFTGTYSYKDWGDDENAEEIGLAYAFAGKSVGNVSQGQFGRVTKESYATPMRAYLRKKDDGVRLTSCAAAVRAWGAASYSVSTGLSEFIDVEFIDENKKTTAVGRLNTVMGEIRVDKWFDLKGRSIGNKANRARGAYYGKKVKK